jgi:tetratricopeptide (TPR) repeat protein
MALKKNTQKRNRTQEKSLNPQRISPKKRLILEACLVVLLAVGIFQMIMPLRAQWYYRYAKNTLDAVFQKKIDPKEHPQVLIRAIYELQRGLQLVPSNGEMWACMGDLLYFTGQYRAAMISQKTALRYFRSPSVYINLGVIYAKLNMYSEAEEALKWALAYCPGQKDAQEALKIVQALRHQ